MKSIIIRLVAGLLLLVIGLFIFIDTFDIYPFKGYYVYQCSECGHQWKELQHLEGRKKCPNYAKVEDPKTGKKVNVCRKNLCAVGEEDAKAVGNYVYIENITKGLIVNTVGGVLAIAGAGLLLYTGYRALMDAPSKNDD